MNREAEKSDLCHFVPVLPAGISAASVRWHTFAAPLSA